MGAGASMAAANGFCTAQLSCHGRVTSGATGYLVPYISTVSALSTASAILDKQGNTLYTVTPVGDELHISDATEKVAVIRKAFKKGMMGQERYQILTTKPTQTKDKGGMFSSAGYKPAALGGRDANGADVYMFAQVQKNMLSVGVPSFTFWVERNKAGMLGTGTNEFQLDTDMSMFTAGFSFPIFHSRQVRRGQSLHTERHNVAAVGYAESLIETVPPGMYTVDCANLSDGLGIICFGIAVNAMLQGHPMLRDPSKLQQTNTTAIPSHYGSGASVPVASVLVASAPVASAPFSSGPCASVPVASASVGSMGTVSYPSVGGMGGSAITGGSEKEALKNMMAAKAPGGMAPAPYNPGGMAAAPASALVASVPVPDFIRSYATAPVPVATVMVSSPAPTTVVTVAAQQVLVSATVPMGVAPGSQLQVTYFGRVTSITLPPTAVAGQLIQFPVPLA